VTRGGRTAVGIAYRVGVGFNPFNKRAQKRGDVFIVVLALAIVAVLVLWAAFPR
jgi:hypothetical protein